MFDIKQIHKKEEKKSITLEIMHSLPLWFNSAQDIDNKYAKEHQEQTFFTAFDENEVIGFITLKEHNSYATEIYNMGVKEQYHRKGIGSLLLSGAENYCKKNHNKFLTVRTLDSSAEYEPYERTRKFYAGKGFFPLEVLTTYWNEENPCLLLAKYLDC
ncbi:MAG: GNAT family N-acetyltransferase [Rickettsiales bacterium]|nr:GNAT family N-acetyltransferase [Rickettsiales bacterium]